MNNAVVCEGCGKRLGTYSRFLEQFKLGRPPAFAVNVMMVAVASTAEGAFLEKPAWTDIRDATPNLFFQESLAARFGLAEKAESGPTASILGFDKILAGGGVEVGVSRRYIGASICRASGRKGARVAEWCAAFLRHLFEEFAWGIESKGAIARMCVLADGSERSRLELQDALRSGLAGFSARSGGEGPVFAEEVFRRTEGRTWWLKPMPAVPVAAPAMAASRAAAA